MRDEIDEKTGKTLDLSYLERGLPPFLNSSIEEMKKSWDILDSGGEDTLWDCKWCDLNSDINVAEVEQIITSEQADYLRKKYLRMVEEEI